MDNIGEAFETLKSELFYRYRGCPIAIEKDGFYWARTFYKTKPEVEGAIDKAYKTIHNSLVNPPKKPLWIRIKRVFDKLIMNGA